MEEASVTQNYVCHELVHGIKFFVLKLEALSFSYQEFFAFSVLQYTYTLVKKIRQVYCILLDLFHTNV